MKNIKLSIILKIWIYAVKIIDSSLKNNTNVIFELVDFAQSLKLKYVIKFKKKKEKFILNSIWSKKTF